MTLGMLPDSTLQIIVTAVCTLALGMWTVWINRNTNKRIDVVAADTKETKMLVNGNMASQLNLTKQVTKRLAEATGNPADQMAAEIADKALSDHVIAKAEADLEAHKQIKNS